MALLVLFSTFSFAVAQHYCGDVLVDSAVFGHTESCGMDVQKPADSSECTIMQDNCCNDEVINVDGQDIVTVSFEEFSLEQQQFIVSFVHSYFSLYGFYGVEAIREIPFKYYTSLFLTRDIHILDQTFII